jgi:hypothetical protein
VTINEICLFRTSDEVIGVGRHFVDIVKGDLGGISEGEISEMVLVA